MTYDIIEDKPRHASKRKVITTQYKGSHNLSSSSSVAVIVIVIPNHGWIWKVDSQLAFIISLQRLPTQQQLSLSANLFLYKPSTTNECIPVGSKETISGFFIP